jgi:hypothetical protein
LRYRNLEDAALPLHVVATDVQTGEPVVLSRGPVTQAVLASSAIPAAFAPVEFDRRLLFDGGLASNTPVRAAVACGARRLVVLPTAPGPGLGVPSGAIATVFHAVTLMTTHQLAREIDRLDASIECHLLPAACPIGISPFDFSRTLELIERGYRITKLWIDEGGMNRADTRAARSPIHHAQLTASLQTVKSGDDGARSAHASTYRQGGTFQQVWRRTLRPPTRPRRYPHTLEASQRGWQSRGRQPDCFRLGSNETQDFCELSRVEPSFHAPRHAQAWAANFQWSPVLGQM